MLRTLTRNRIRLVGVGVLTLVSVLALPPTAIAAERHTVVKEEEPDAPKGGGVLLENTPGAYYMGRLWKGQTFDVHGHVAKRHTGTRNRSHYYFGYAGGTVRQCMWIGPSAHIRKFKKYLSGEHRTVKNRCSRRDLAYLRARHGANIGIRFNCEPGLGATFGTRTKLRYQTDFYYNLRWRSNYSGGTPRDKVERPVKRKQTVYYRYTTRDKKMAVVYVEGLGWGFVSARAVDRKMNEGYWHRPNGPRIKCGEKA